jgi:S1-C subfamily serine protease
MGGISVVLVVVGCATSTHGENVSGVSSIPGVVNPPDSVPPELQPYTSRFEEILEFWGFKMGATKDPQALQLRLEYSGIGAQARVTAYLMRQGRAQLTATAVPNKTMPWHWFTTPEKDELVQELAENAINQFDNQLHRFTEQNQIVKAPGAATTAPPAEGGFTAYGTAFAVDSPNTFLTARHVVAGATSIELHCSHDKSGSAVIEYNDAGNDIAVLHSDMKADAFLELAPNDSLALGDHVFTIGFPVWSLLGVNPKYTEGVVSALSGIGDSKNVMQITVPIQPGNSGGPLVDSHGQVVGIITATAAIPYFYHHTGTVPQNINYAVPSYYAYPLVKDIQHADARAMAKMTPVDRVTQSVCFVAVKGTSQYIQ